LQRLMKFLTVLFFIFLGIWLFGLIARAVVAGWLRRRTEEFNRAAREAQDEARRRGRREGEIIIETTETTVEKKISRNVGDYVEFEEIKVTDRETEIK